MIILLAIIIFVGTLVIDLYTDYNLWKKKVPVNHSRGLILRLVGLIPSGVLLGVPYIVPMLLGIAVVGFIYWFLFDGLFNILRKLNWWSTGTNDPDDAKTDNFLQSIPLWLHKTIKIGLIVISLTFYLVYRL